MYLIACPADDHVYDGGDEDSGHGHGGDELPAEEPVGVRPAPSHQLDVVRKPEQSKMEERGRHSPVLIQ